MKNHTIPACLYALILIIGIVCPARCDSDLVLEVASGELRTFQEPQVQALMPSPCNDTLALVTGLSKSSPQTLALYRGTTGEKLWSQHLPENNVHTLAFSNDGRWMAVGGTRGIISDRGDEISDHGVVRIFEAKSGHLRAALTIAPHGLIHSLCFAPHAPLLAVGGNRWIELWNYSTGKRIGSIDTNFVVITLAFSPDGTKLVSPFLCDVKTRRLLASFPVDNCYATAFSPDGKTLALTGTSSVRLYNVDTGTLLWKQDLYDGFRPSYDAEGATLQFSSDGKLLASGGESRSHVLDAKTGAIVSTVPNLNTMRLGAHGEVWGFQMQTPPNQYHTKVPLVRWPNIATLPPAGAAPVPVLPHQLS